MRNNKNNITSGLENITLNLQNIIPHFTGKAKIITLLSIIIILSFTNITLCLSSVLNTSALSYSSDVNIGFTFNPTISLSISPYDLTIPNLTPGTDAESNTITVNVATNTAYGYHLTANVGSDTTNYNTTNLVHASSATSTPTSNATFASLAYGASVANKDNLSTNTWGYSYSNDSGTTWRPYSGLPLYSDTSHSTNLINTYTAADSKSIEFKIAAKASETQPSGDYTNIINFYATSVPEPPLLYDVVESMSKGTLAENNVKLSDTITQANSGVYTYDPEVYGVASDASNDYPIYFYRGILDTDAGLGTYGSDGKADAWPNYVKLGNNTCWRIVRTTGSGGTKMIYNGMYGATTAGSCANAGGEAAASSQPFGLKGNSSKTDWYKNINRVGYTFNNNPDIQDTMDPVSVDIVFGSNSNYTETNTTNSNIKNYLENTWFAGNMGDYESRLEPSAGYCNDRSVYSDAITNSALSEISPYDTSGAIYFGAYGRNINANNAKKDPSLSCLHMVADLYSISGSIGNGQLFRPVALLTADEASFVGSGRSSGAQAPVFHTNSYLRSGSNFWLLSPYSRSSIGISYGSYLYSNGNIGGNSIDSGYYVRPVISLMHHIQVTSGSGTATSPWTIE